MRNFLPSAIFASALLAGPALARDEPAKPFQGAKVTAIVGVDNGSSFAGDGTGVVYGGQFGYDVQSGGTVYGIEGEVTGASTRNCYSGAVISGDRFCDKADRDLYVGGRLGRVVGSATLLYVKAGYTNARDQFDYRDGRTGSTDYSGGGVRSGVRGGVGVETQISAKVTAKAEYRYSNYSNSDYSRNQGVVGIGFRF